MGPRICLLNMTTHTPLNPSWPAWLFLFSLALITIWHTLQSAYFPGWYLSCLPAANGMSQIGISALVTDKCQVPGKKHGTEWLINKSLINAMNKWSQVPESGEQDPASGPEKTWQSKGGDSKVRGWGWSMEMMGEEEASWWELVRQSKSAGSPSLGGQWLKGPSAVVVL